MGEILHPLVGSTLTPVVVFIPLAFLDGLPGVFFRSLALTMVVALLTSLVLAVTLTPSLASLFLRDRAHLEHGHAPKAEEGGFVMRPLLRPVRGGAAADAALALGHAAGVPRASATAAGRFTASCPLVSCPTWTKAAS